MKFGDWHSWVASVSSAPRCGHSSVLWRINENDVYETPRRSGRQGMRVWLSNWTLTTYCLVLGLSFNPMWSLGPCSFVLGTGLKPRGCTVTQGDTECCRQVDDSLCCNLTVYSTGNSVFTEQRNLAQLLIIKKNKICGIYIYCTFYILWLLLVCMLQSKPLQMIEHFHRTDVKYFELYIPSRVIFIATLWNILPGLQRWDCV